jgi:hypothetical protein
LYTGVDNHVIDDVAINTCDTDTCGGQRLVCPGLNATKACTPGYDCDFMNCCDTFCVGKGTPAGFSKDHCQIRQTRFVLLFGGGSDKFVRMFIEMIVPYGIHKYIASNHQPGDHLLKIG